jgi:hypothetical protein
MWHYIPVRINRQLVPQQQYSHIVDLFYYSADFWHFIPFEIHQKPCIDQTTQNDSNNVNFCIDGHVKIDLIYQTVNKITLHFILSLNFNNHSSSNCLFLHFVCSFALKHHEPRFLRQGWVYGRMSGEKGWRKGGKNSKTNGETISRQFSHPFSHLFPHLFSNFYSLIFNHFQWQKPSFRRFVCSLALILSDKVEKEIINFKISLKLSPAYFWLWLKLNLPLITVVNFILCNKI